MFCKMSGGTEAKIKKAKHRVFTKSQNTICTEKLIILQKKSTTGLPGYDQSQSVKNMKHKKAFVCEKFKSNFVNKIWPLIFGSNSKFYSTNVCKFFYIFIRLNIWKG